MTSLLANTLLNPFKRDSLKSQRPSLAFLCLCVSFWCNSSFADLQSTDLGNHSLSDSNLTRSQQLSEPQESQLSPEDYQRIMKELNAAKQAIEERNKMLDKMINEK
ncbi:MAG: hypothetical protein KDD35_07780 [Bdellovibrionales bacterium]|nr:hypothetical protein [Bdellovibrionales bacterium]